MKKIISLIFLFTLFLSPLSFSSLSPSLVKEAEFGEVGAVVLKTALAQNIGTLGSLVTPGFSFRLDLLPGDTDPAVKELQRVLNADIDTIVAVEDAGSRGKETTYFGNLTKLAVIKFQNKYRNVILTPAGLTVGTGSVNKLTRIKLNLLLGIMTTYDSVGYPQNRPSANPVTPPVTPVTPVNPAPVQPTMTTCQFVELLINIGAITPANASRARSAMNCSPAVVNTFVDLRVNGGNGPLTVSKNSVVTLSWTTSGVTSCSSGSVDKPLTGSQSITMESENSTFSLICRTATGTNISDSVLVRITGNDSKPYILESTNFTFGYTTALYRVDTDVPTKVYITYRTNSTDEKTVSLTNFADTHIGTLSGLIPNTTYYVQLRVVDADGGEFTSPENEFKTVAYPDDNSGNNDDDNTLATDTLDIKQRVLYSSDGEGVISIAESESLKTNSAVTLEAWVKPTAWSTKNGMSNTMDQVIISKGNIGGNIDYVLSLDNGKLVYSNNDASLWTCSPVVPLNQWTHVAVAVDEATSKLDLFINGTKVSPTAQITVATTTASGATTTATVTTDICEGTRGVFSKLSKIDKTKAITNSVTSFVDQPAASSLDSTVSVEDWVASPTSQLSLSGSITSNVHIGNFYPKMCSSAEVKGNGFIGYIDDVRIWNKARTEIQVKDNMKKSVKDSADLVGYYSFDDGTASDVSININTGSLKGDMEIIEDNTVESKMIGPDYSYGAGFTVSEVCDSSSPALEPIEPPDPKTDIAGVVTRVTKCTQTKSGFSLTEVEIKPCNSGDTTASRFEPNEEGIMMPAGESSGNIFITLRDNMTPVPKVGDEVLGKVVPDKSGTCSALAGGVTPSAYSYEGIVTGQFGISAPSGNCANTPKAGSEGSSHGNYWIGNDDGLFGLSNNNFNVGFGLVRANWGGERGSGVSVLGNTFKFTTEEGRIFGIKLW